MEPGAVAGVLAGLVEGERAWFWWCAAASAPASCLLVQPLAVDPSMAQLRADIAETSRPRGARTLSGLLQVEPGGRLALMGSQGSMADLAALAAWVQAQHAAHPGLARLRGASLRMIDGAGTVIALLSDDALWAGVPEVQDASHIEQAAHVLQGLEDGEQAWFWMTPHGLDGQAALVVSRQEDDAGGERFSAQVQALRLRGAQGAGALQGLVRRQGDTLSLLTTVAAKDWADTVAALLGQGSPRLRLLRRAQLVYLKDGAARKTLPLPVHRDLCETIDVLREDGEAWFWFSAAASHGEPLLILRRDREALKVAAQAAGGPGVRGRLLTQPGGAVILQLKEAEEEDDLRPALLSWARSESQRWPGLRRLKGIQIQTRA